MRNAEKQKKEVSWITIISFLIFYIAGVITSVIYGEEILGQEET